MKRDAVSYRGFAAAAQASQRLHLIAQELVTLVGTLTSRTCGQAVTPQSPHFMLYLQRLQRCRPDNVDKIGQKEPCA